MQVGSIPLTLAEQKRRNERKARFNSTNGSSNSAIKTRTSTASSSPKRDEEFLLQPLTSTRQTKRAKTEVTVAATGVSATQRQPFVGTNQSLEKDYLRLTTFPKAELVRPLPILQQALAHIKRRYVQTEDFDWCNEQLKSVRQDLTVQSIRTHFVLDVYETHARILLEHGDLDEFNQCQCNIRHYTTSSAPFADDDGGSLNDDSAPNHLSLNTNSGSATETSTGSTSTLLQQTPQSAREFRAYAVLYSLVRHAATDLKLQLQQRKGGMKWRRQCRSAAITTGMTLSGKDKKQNNRHKRKRTKHEEKTSSTTIANGSQPSQSSPSIPNGDIDADNVTDDCEDHALAVVRAVQSNNVVAFFRLYATAPHMSAYLMDFLVQRVRTAAYAAVVAAHRPNVTMALVQDRLRFSDMDETMRFLRAQQAVFVASDATDARVDCQKSNMALVKKES